MRGFLRESVPDCVQDPPRKVLQVGGPLHRLPRKEHDKLGASPAKSGQSRRTRQNPKQNKQRKFQIRTGESKILRPQVPGTEARNLKIAQSSKEKVHQRRFVWCMWTTSLLLHWCKIGLHWCRRGQHLCKRLLGDPVPNWQGRLLRPPPNQF